MDPPNMAAGELALGVLEGDDRVHALRRVLAEPDFAREVEQWRGHLAQLFDLWPSVVPPQRVFARIERSIDAAAMPRIDVPARASRFWPAATALSSIAAAALMAVVLGRPEEAPFADRPASRPPVMTTATPKMLVAAIDPSVKGSPVTAIYDPVSGSLRLTVATFARTDRSAELWVIAGDKVPHSLGLLDVTGNTTVVVAPVNRIRLSTGAVLAISLEPVGGSPTGLPTGPVVATGALSQV